LIVVVYPVRDLAMVRTVRGTIFEYQQLTELISETIAPTTWRTAGGPASISANPAAAAILVEQTRGTQKQIELLLTALRKVRDLQNIRPGETITVGLGRPGWMGIGAGANPATAPPQPQPTTTSQLPAAGPANSPAPPNVTGHP
jgi:hypothetical protein